LHGLGRRRGVDLPQQRSNESIFKEPNAAPGQAASINPMIVGRIGNCLPGDVTGRSSARYALRFFEKFPLWIAASSCEADTADSQAGGNGHIVKVFVSQIIKASFVVLAFLNFIFYNCVCFWQASSFVQRFHQPNSLIMQTCLLIIQ